MPDWFSEFATTQVDADISTLATRLILAWACGLIVARIARWNQPTVTADSLTLTLILMSVLIAMATQIIGDNVARAFSLVGALSIVRFRTAVSATRDIAFVLAAVVVGMAVGAGQYSVAGVGLAVLGMATQLNRDWFNDTDKATGESNTGPPDQNNSWRITMQVGLSSTDGWEAELTRLTKRFQLTSAETTRRGAAMELVYRVFPKENLGLAEIVAAMNGLSGVESVTAKAN